MVFAALSFSWDQAFHSRMATGERCIQHYVDYKPIIGNFCVYLSVKE